MICIICRQAEIIDGFTSAPFERDEMKLIVNTVPAHVCPNCGEAYLDEKVSIKLLQFVEEKSNMGVIEGIHEYSEIVDKIDS
ncbi:MAG: type II toxin-antitoxin system MqsA family antitoxin [Chloroflexi bacterium]|nr:type II toxin-antitoxin system MqsA family antitoxin [Chloroflexota bacterium]